MKIKYLLSLLCTIIAANTGCQTLGTRSPSQLWRACCDSACAHSCDSLSSYETSRQTDRWGTPIEPNSDPSAIAASIHGDVWTTNRYRPQSTKYHFQDKAPRPLAKGNPGEGNPGLPMLQIGEATQPALAGPVQETTVVPASFSVSDTETSGTNSRHRLSDSLHISEAVAAPPSIIHVQKQSSLSEGLEPVVSTDQTASAISYGSTSSSDVFFAEDLPLLANPARESATLYEATELELD